MQLIPKFREWSSSWEVYFPQRGSSKGQRRFFTSEALAKTAISEWRKGDTKQHLGLREAEEVLHVKSLLPAGTSLLEVVRFFLEHNQGLTSVTVKVAADAYLRDILRSASGKYQEEQTRVVREAILGLGPDTPCSSLTRAGLIAFITEPDSYWNRYGRKRAVSCLLSKAVELGAIKPGNHPLLGWKFEDAPKRTPHTLSLADAGKVMEYVLAEKPELVPAFALQLFAGVRTEELCRPATDGRRPLSWADLDYGQKVTVPVEVSKTSERRVIDFWPEALTHWLQPFAIGQACAVCPVPNLEDVESKLLSELDVDFQQNDFRRTYASYAYALHGAKVQDWLGHTDGRMLKKHYKDFKSPAEAAAFFALAPAPLSPTNVIPISA